MKELDKLKTINQQIDERITEFNDSMKALYTKQRKYRSDVLFSILNVLDILIDMAAKYSLSEKDVIYNLGLTPSIGSITTFRDLCTKVQDGKYNGFVDLELRDTDVVIQVIRSSTLMGKSYMWSTTIPIEYLDHIRDNQYFDDIFNGVKQRLQRIAADEKQRRIKLLEEQLQKLKEEDN